MEHKHVQLFSRHGLEISQLQVMQPTQVVLTGWLERGVGGRRDTGQGPDGKVHGAGVRCGWGAPSRRTHLRKTQEVGSKAAFTSWSTRWRTQGVESSMHQLSARGSTQSPYS